MYISLNVIFFPAIFEVHEDFFMYKSGIYRYSNVTQNEGGEARKSGYHSVRLLG